MKREITRDDILPLEAYGAMRAEKRAAVTALKRGRRLEVGPHATFYFENYETMWRQVHEMLFVERGGEDQIADELAAYNPLIPKGRELVATLMFEIPDATRRHRILGTLGGVEETTFLRVGGETIRGVAEADMDRSTADGKASSVQFIHFPFQPEQIRRFRKPRTEVVLGIDHGEYAHMAVIPERVRAALASDFDALE